MLKKHYHLLTILSLALLIQAPVWLGRTDFLSGGASDLIPYIYGTKQFIYDTFQKLHEVPLWNPYFMFGQPIAGNVQYNIFYPLNIFFFLIPFFKALWMYQVVHMVIAGTGAFLLAGHTGASRNGSLVAACLYMLNGRLLYYINAGWLHLFTSICLIPLLLLTALLLLEREKRAYAIGLGLVFFMMFTSGNPQHALFFCFLFFGQIIWHMLRLPSKAERLSLFYRILLAGLLSFLLISIQLFPALEQTYLSSRILATGSLPGFHFNWDAAQWFRILFRPEILFHDHAWELCAYIGIGGMILAFYGFSPLRKHLPLIVIWGVIPFLVSMGPDFPPAAMLLRAVPGMDILSSSSRYFIFSILILTLMAGHGFDKLVDSFKANSKKMHVYLLLAALMLSIAGLLIPPSGHIGSWVQVRFFGAIAVFLTLAFLYLWRGTMFFKIILIGWLIADPLLFATQVLKENYKLKDFKPPLKIINTLAQITGPVRVATIQPEALRDSLLNPFDDWISFKYGIRRAGGDEPLAMRRTLNFLARMDGTGMIQKAMWGFRLWGFARPDLFNIAGVTHLITFRPMESPQLRFVVRDSITMPHFHGGWWRGQPVYLYENKGALPRAFLWPGSRNNPVRPVEINIVSPNRIQLRVHAGQAGRLVVSESFHPGWRAFSRDKSFKLEPFLNAFISMQVPPGNFEILLDFFPQSLRIGLWLTLAGFMLVILTAVLEKLSPGKPEAISKKSFGPTRRRRTSLFVGTAFQILDILEYACRRSRQQAGRVATRSRVLVPSIFGGRA